MQMEDASPFAFQQSSWFGATSPVKWKDSSHFFLLRHVLLAKQLGIPMQMSHPQEGCATFAQDRRTHTELLGCAIPLLLLLMPREVCRVSNTRLVRGG